MKIYFKNLIYLTIALLFFGCTNHLTFNELTKKYNSKFDKFLYSSAEMNYSISILKQLELVERDYNNDTLKFELFVDSSMVFEEGAKTILILKYNPKDTNLNLVDAWSRLTHKRRFENFRIYSKGLTNLLTIPAYYEHSAYSMSNKNTESINLFFRGKSSDFYVLNLQVITEDDYPVNIRELLSSAKTIHIN